VRHIVLYSVALKTFNLFPLSLNDGAWTSWFVSCRLGVGSLPEFDFAANSTTPPAEVTDLAGLSVAEEHHREPHVFSIGVHNGGRLRFSGSVYFLSCAGVTGVAALCFLALRCCCCRPDVHAAAKRNDDDNVESQETGFQDPASSTNRPQRVSTLPRQSTVIDVATDSAHDRPNTSKSSPSTSRKKAMCGASTEPLPTTTVTTVLDDGTERQSSIAMGDVKKPTSRGPVKRASGDVDTHKPRRATVAGGSLGPDTEAPLTTSTPVPGLTMSTPAPSPHPELVARNRRHVKPLRFRMKSVDIEPVSGGRPKLFRLLIVIVVWTSAVVGGPLSTVASYACYPVGSRSFVAGAVVADVMAALACVAAARATAGRGDVSTIIAMTCLGTIVLIYYTALVLFSLQPQQQQQQQQLETRTTEMPLFGSTAEMLTVSDTLLLY